MDGSPLHPSDRASMSNIATICNWHGIVPTTICKAGGGGGGGAGLIYHLSTWPQLQGMWIFSRCMWIVSPPCGINDKLYGGVAPPPSYNLQNIRGVTRLCHYHYKPTIMVDVFYLFIKVKSF
jgi:hypothetical protein